MEMTKGYINEELVKAQDLLWSGSINQIDAAHNLITNLILNLQENKNSVGA
jgi:hypothetical protein